MASFELDGYSLPGCHDNKVNRLVGVSLQAVAEIIMLMYVTIFTQLLCLQ